MKTAANGLMINQRNWIWEANLQRLLAYDNESSINQNWKID